MLVATRWSHHAGKRQAGWRPGWVRVSAVMVLTVFASQGSAMSCCGHAAGTIDPLQVADGRNPMTDGTGERVKAARIARGVSQAGLAKSVGVSNSYMSHIEAGRRPVSRVIRDQIPGQASDADPGLNQRHDGQGRPNHSASLRERRRSHNVALPVPVRLAGARLPCSRPQPAGLLLTD